MKHLTLIVGVLALVPTVWFFHQYSNAGEGRGTRFLIYSGISLLIAAVFAGIFFYKKFKEEGEKEISITKF